MARIVDLLSCQMAARVGLLADIAEALSEAGVNIIGVCAYEMEGAGDFMLVVSDAMRAKAALEAYGAEVSIDTAVTAELADRMGALAEASRRLADAGINVEFTFGSACGGDRATIVFKTSDDEAAVAALG